MILNRFYVFMVVAVMSFSFAAITGGTDGNAQEKQAVSASTLENLMSAYKVETDAHNRYMAFAKQAEKEGYGIAASLFRAAALAEQVHYERDGALIKKSGGTPEAGDDAPIVKSTGENLEAAIKAEDYENKVMYPEFLRIARQERNEEAADAFEDARAAEGSHVLLYKSVQKNLALSQGLVRDFYVCPLCGNIMDALTRTVCPICGISTKKFKRVR